MLSTPLVCVLPKINQTAFGLNYKGELRPVYDSAKERGRRRWGVDLSECEIVDVRDAVTRTFDSASYFVSYVVRGRSGQPRIRKDALDILMREHGFPMPTVNVLFGDFDRNPREPWTSREQIEEVIAEMRRLPLLQHAGIYSTRRGIRVVLWLDREIPVLEVEPYITGFHDYCAERGISLDRKCSDWTHVYRVANYRDEVRDDGNHVVGRETIRAAVVDFSSFAPVPPPLPAARLLKPAQPRPSARARPMSSPNAAFAAVLPSEWDARVERVAKAVRGVQSDWHGLFLAMAGAWLDLGVDPLLVPALNEAVSRATGADTRTDDRRRSAATTVSRWRAGERNAGIASLRWSHPAVAHAIRCALAPPEPPPPPPKDSREVLTGALRSLPDGVTVFACECGIGKTAAVIAIAAERARTPSKSDPTKLARRGNQTLIACTTNELAIQVTRDLRAQGISTARYFGPLSLLEADGVTPVCKKHKTARPLADGGISTPYNFCEGRGTARCEFYETCRARPGVEADEEPRVHVYPAALLKKAEKRTSGLTLAALDEPDPLLLSEHIRLSDIRHALAELGDFEPRYGAVMTAVLEQLIAWATAADPLVSVELRSLVQSFTDDRTGNLTIARNATNMPTSASLIECLKEALDPDLSLKGAPVRDVYLAFARNSEARALTLGRACKTLHTLYRQIVSDDRTLVRLAEEDDGELSLALTFPNADLLSFLRSEGAKAVLDAGAQAHLPVYRKLLGYEPYLVEVSAADGAQITRTMLRLSSANKKGWFDRRGMMTLSDGFIRATEQALELAMAHGEMNKLAIISMKTVRVLLEAALHPESTTLARQWEELGQPPAVLTYARQRLGPVLRRWPGQIVFGHYGAIRGLNSMSDADALITFGDPFPNLGDVWCELQFLELEGSKDRSYVLCAVELEQAHGRVRAPHRTRPARVIHVGVVRPGGAGWRSHEVVVREVGAGRASGLTADVSLEEVEALVAKAGGTRAVADRLGVTTRLVQYWVAGEKPLPKVHHDALA